MKVDNNKIKQLRVSKGWTQQHLADACGVSLRTIQRIEKTGITSMDTVSAFCSVFDFERDELITHGSGQNKMNLNIHKLMFIGFLVSFILGYFFGSLSLLG